MTSFSPNTLILMKNMFFSYFKSQISKWKHITELLSVSRGLKVSYIQNNKKKISSHQSPCTYEFRLFFFILKAKYENELNFLPAKR